MIFVNLLPDVKLQFLKARRYRRILVSVAFITVPSCVVLCALLYFWYWHNPSKIDQLIKSNNQLIETDFNEQRIADMLNSKARIEHLTRLHRNKTNPENLVAGPNYLGTLIPSTSDYEIVSFDFVENTFVLNGKTDDLGSAEALRETINFIGYEECREDNRYKRLYPFRYDDFPAPESSIYTTDRLSYIVSGRFAAKLFDSQVKNDSLVVPQIDVNLGSRAQENFFCYRNPNQLEWTDQGGNPSQVEAVETQEGQEG